MNGDHRETVRGAGWVFAGLLLLCMLCMLLYALPAAAETTELAVSVPETVKGYTPCKIIITSPAAGEAELRLLDTMQNVWLVRKEQITEGENELSWDGQRMSIRRRN